MAPDWLFESQVRSHSSLTRNLTCLELTSFSPMVTAIAGYRELLNGRKLIYQFDLCSDRETQEDPSTVNHLGKFLSKKKYLLSISTNLHNISKNQKLSWLELQLNLAERCTWEALSLTARDVDGNFDKVGPDILYPAGKSQIIRRGMPDNPAGYSATFKKN